VTEPRERVAIFGATSAIAAEVAQLYARRGARLFLAGRDPGKLGALVGALGGAVAGSREVDLTAPGAAAGAVAAALDALGGRMDVALIAHGWLGDQLLSERDAGEARRIIDTNFVSVVDLLVPLGNHFEAAGGGHIAVMSSVAGERGRPRNYTYAAAKGALNVYLQGLRTRLWARGVGVHTLKLGPVDTPMTATHRKNVLFARADRVAAGIVAAIDAGRAEAYVPWFWLPIMAVVRNVPERLFQRLPALSGR
jgi:decaprenylphospho-beta-D-erythro-pentofuranosid-2-ulose 2-reductase